VISDDPRIPFRLATATMVAVNVFYVAQDAWRHR
jgi:hypothetical protein